MNFTVDFAQLQELPTTLQWQGRFDSYKLQQGVGLLVQPSDKTDFWSKTYYDPPFVKNDGVTLTYKVPVGTNTWSLEVHFGLEARNQFDQAGIIVQIDSERWMKTGIEYVDGVPRMGAVVTNNYSDWSTQPWKGETSRFKIRVSRIRHSLVAEYLDDDNQWNFMRITRLTDMEAPDTIVSAGAYTCAPTKSGVTAIFECINFKDSVQFDHSN